MCPIDPGSVDTWMIDEEVSPLLIPPKDEADIVALNGQEILR